MNAVRAKYENGVLTPLEPLDLEEGAEVMVSVEDAPVETPEAKPAAEGTEGSESILEMFERLRNSVPPGAWDNMPRDFVRNKKHYLYGHPKEEEEEQ